YLRPGEFIDSDAPEVVSLAENAAKGLKEKLQTGVRLYYAVRDGIQYDPYRIDLSREGLKASSIIRKGFGYCVAKAAVLAAACRACGIPSRVGFADVRNHLSTERLRKLMKTDIFIYHGYTEMFLEGKWVKATPAFNLSLCDRFRVNPLEFDGKKDSLFHEYNRDGDRHLEYVRDHGVFADLPYETIVAMFRKHYPGYFKAENSEAGSFEKEADREEEAGGLRG
ncbi:MAG TPA: transglutaminase family protein, partial [Syntrophales bacterium]|nr:transglutaminase family protein [Syntrophales bacterium]